MTVTADAQMIPVRALNQVTYCPRLYYLQYVDAVMPTNEHVEGGLFDHRRVDEPDLANKTRKEGDASRSRGVHLSSETLGISGVLDVIEEKDGAVVSRRDEARLRPARRRRQAERPGTTTPCSCAARRS